MTGGDLVELWAEESRRSRDGLIVADVATIRRVGGES